MSLATAIDLVVFISSAIQVYRTSTQFHVPSGTGIKVEDRRGERTVIKSTRIVRDPLDLMSNRATLFDHGSARFDELFPRGTPTGRSVRVVILSEGNDLMFDKPSGRLIGAKERFFFNLTQPGRWGAKLALLGVALAFTDFSVRLLTIDHRGLVERIFSS